ncbi:putative non-F420 flavinoid oxidoreductase [Diaminobutyricimonas aerilata]|uniref:Putative non-F420 flavinoid oxidoreductase n=1 Tax=Diaminobutyricimonas aerilata TaxID=1162967 RepID=A0A2M9CIL0_9MICO|nr:TIGR03885 family FMN-dependent LLM class oxidoreductase [Diaminobutyricimonas aerilata]PJJ71741.1 putative non-F420 flavinoid oxidoreductase [Diaminobutyricimonas aerilata]
MTVYGFHASHEQIPPARLLDDVRSAESAGFDAGMCSDHFAPWSERQGESGFAWAWLGAALQATSWRFGVVNAPGQRYHPAIIAQAAATLESMYPGRFWVAVGSGEAMNEHITGERWPAKAERNARLRECVDIMRALFAGEEVTHRGLVTVDRARLWTRPETPPPLIGPAVTPQTAAWAASWADGLATINQPIEKTREVVDAYRDAGGRGPIVLQLHVSWAADDDTALRIAHDQWRTNVFPPPLSWDLDTPEHFDAAARDVPLERMPDSVIIASDAAALADRIREYVALGADEVYLHNVGRDNADFIDAAGSRILPLLRGEHA